MFDLEEADEREVVQGRRIRAILVLCSAVVVSMVLDGCATVPKEVVELSYLVGRDLNALHASYDKLIHDRYEDFRKQRLDYLENVWKPHYIRNWIAEGGLLRLPRGKLSGTRRRATSSRSPRQTGRSRRMSQDS